MSVVTSIVLPNGTSYSFQYEPGSYGGLTSVTLPTGATISYTWATLSPSGKFIKRTATSQTGRSRWTTKVFTWAFNKSCIGLTLFCNQHRRQRSDRETTRSISTTDGNIVSAKIYSGAVGSTLLRQYDIGYNLPPGESGCFAHPRHNHAQERSSVERWSMTMTQPGAFRAMCQKPANTVMTRPDRAALTTCTG